MQKILFSLSLILAGITCGYLLQQILRQHFAKADTLLPHLRKALQRTSMLGLMPLAYIGATWVMLLPDLRVALLPLLGGGVIICGGILGLLATRLLKKSGSQKSVLFCCGAFSNIGSFGGLVSFIFFGEQGFALLVLYRLFEEILYYGVGFPVARFLSIEHAELQIVKRLLETLRDPFFLVGSGSFLAGILLNLSGLERPAILDTLNNIFVPTGIFLLLVSIGLGMRFSVVRNYLIEGVTVSLIKFVALPLVAGIASWLFGLHAIQDGLPMKVALVAASMPVAFNALVVASVYDLDLDLANSCWLITTASLLFVLPWLYFLCTLL